MLTNTHVTNNYTNIKAKLAKPLAQLPIATSLICVILSLSNCIPLWAAAGATEDRTTYDNPFGPANGLLIFLYA